MDAPKIITPGYSPDCMPLNVFLLSSKGQVCALGSGGRMGGGDWVVDRSLEDVSCGGGRQGG